MKRRKPRRIYNPKGLADIPKNVITHWKVYGPIIPGEEYSSWEEWRKVYEGCREELLEKIQARRERLLQEPKLSGQVKDGLPACERIYLAMLQGLGPEGVQRQIAEEVRADDPRRRLGK